MTDSVLAQPDTESTPFQWSDAATDAAVLVAEDRLTDAAIARKVGVSRSTLARWKRHPEFRAQVTTHYDELQARARKRGIARLDRRIASANDRHTRMETLIKARAKDLRGEVAGGSTGLLVRTLKHVTVRYEKDPDRPDSEPFTTREEVFEYTFDAALMREIRELEKHAAQDAGQWSNKVAISGPNDGPVQIEHKSDLDAQIDALAAEYGITREAVLALMDGDDAEGGDDDP